MVSKSKKYTNSITPQLWVNMLGLEPSFKAKHYFTDPSDHTSFEEKVHKLLENWGIPLRGHRIWWAGQGKIKASLQWKLSQFNPCDTFRWTKPGYVQRCWMLVKGNAFGNGAPKRPNQLLIQWANLLYIKSNY